MNENAVNELKKLYNKKLLPLEHHHQFHTIQSAKLEDVDFDAKPVILLLGQNSTIRTTFVRYLLKCDDPPTDYMEADPDRFIVLTFDEKERTIPGNALVDDPKHQFRSLATFGNAFLNRFQCSTGTSVVLQSLTIVDTPGIMAGENQSDERGYDFIGILEWFAERVDRIVLVFDARKLDISDELSRCIEALSGNEEKVRLVLSVSEITDQCELMRAYGALMWSLGRVLSAPDIARVYIGFFGDDSSRFKGDRQLFVEDEKTLLDDLHSISRQATMRKLNDLIKRARLAKVNAYVMAEVYAQMPTFFGKDTKKIQLIKNLSKIYDKVHREHQITCDSFPDLEKMQLRLKGVDFKKLHSLKPSLLKSVDEILNIDIGWLLELVPLNEY